MEILDSVLERLLGVLDLVFVRRMEWVLAIVLVKNIDKAIMQRDWQRQFSYALKKIYIES